MSWSSLSGRNFVLCGNYNESWRGIHQLSSLLTRVGTLCHLPGKVKRRGRQEEGLSSPKVWWANTLTGSLSCSGRYSQRSLCAQFLCFKFVHECTVSHPFTGKSSFFKKCPVRLKNPALMGIPSAELISINPSHWQSKWILFMTRATAPGKDGLWAMQYQELYAVEQDNLKLCTWP